MHNTVLEVLLNTIQGVTSRDNESKNSTAERNVKTTTVPKKEIKINDKVITLKNNPGRKTTNNQYHNYVKII